MLERTKLFFPKGWNDVAPNKRARLAYVKANGWEKNTLPDRPGCWSKAKAPTSPYYYVWNPATNVIERDYHKPTGTPRGRPKIVHVATELVELTSWVWERLPRHEKIQWLVRDGFEYNGLTNSWVRPEHRGSKRYYMWNPRQENKHPLLTNDRVVL
jgi:hypothetical protein